MIISPIFAHHALARSIETAQSRNQMHCVTAHRRLYTDSFYDCRTIGSGTALYAGPESPLTQAFGLGFSGEISKAEIEEMEDFFFSRQTAVHIEVSMLADMSLTRILNQRGYTVSEYTSVLGYNLQCPAEHFPFVPSTVITGITDEEIPLAARAMSAGFLETTATDLTIPQGFQDLFALFCHIPNSVCSIERVGDEIAGGATLFYDHEHEQAEHIAMLAGASVQPQYRRRGIQQRLIAHRLYSAREHGCTLAVVSTQPGTISQSNMQRTGFQVLYGRVKFTKHYTARL